MNIKPSTFKQAQAELTVVKEIPGRCDHDIYPSGRKFSFTKKKNEMYLPESEEYYIARGQPFLTRFSREEIDKKVNQTGGNLLSGTKFMTRGHYILVLTKKGHYELLTNFNPIPKARVTVKTTGNEENYIEFQIQLKRSSHTFSIKSSEMEKFYKKMKQAIPAAYVFADAGKGEESLREYIAEILEEKWPSLIEKEIYRTGGWWKIGKRMMYLSGRDENCMSERKLAETKGCNRHLVISRAFEVLEIAPRQISVPIFLFAHSGYVKKLFSEAGLPIQFIFDLIGPTGSRKTSLVKVLFGLFQDINQRGNFVNFSSTPRAMEIVGEQNVDGVVILDDLSDAMSSVQIDKFEKFLRSLCDQEGRRRSTDGGRTLDIVETQFTAILTAESYFDDMPQSSKLRNIAQFIDENTICNTVLSRFQEDQRVQKNSGNHSSLELYMTIFIEWVGENWKELLHRLSGYVPNPIGIKYARLEEARRVLHGMAMLVLDFACAHGIYRGEDGRSVFYEWTRYIDELILLNQNLCQSAAPEVMFLTALRDLISCGELKISAGKADFERLPDFYCGFHDGEFVKINPLRAFDSVRNYYLKAHQKFDFSANMIFSNLVSRGFSEGYKERNRTNSRPLKKVVINGQKMQFLCLKAAVLNIDKR